MFRCLTELAQDPTKQTYDQDIAIVPERVLSLRSLCNAVLTLDQSRNPDKSEDPADSDNQRIQTNGNNSNNVEDQADSDDSRSQTNGSCSDNIENQADSDNQRSQTNSNNSNNIEAQADSDNSRSQTNGSGSDDTEYPADSDNKRSPVLDRRRNFHLRPEPNVRP